MLGWFSEASVRALALEAGQMFAIVCESLRQNFNRDGALELRVPRAVHLARAARADLAGDFIWAESSARS
jgi:hypothetical protein